MFSTWGTYIAEMISILLQWKINDTIYGQTRNEINTYRCRVSCLNIKGCFLIFYFSIITYLQFIIFFRCRFSYFLVSSLLHCMFNEERYTVLRFISFHRWFLKEMSARLPLFLSLKKARDFMSSSLCLYVYSFFMDFVFLTSYHELESESNMNVVSEFLKFKFLMLMLLC